LNRHRDGRGGIDIERERWDIIDIEKRGVK